MIPQEQLNKRANKLYEDIKGARVYLDSKVIEGTIKKKIIENNVIKVFVSISNNIGTITKIEIYDKDNEIVQFEEMNAIKDKHYKFLAVVEIRIEGGSL